MMRLALACAFALGVMTACADTGTDVPLAMEPSEASGASDVVVQLPPQEIPPLAMEDLFSTRGMIVNPICIVTYPADLAEAGAEARCYIRYSVNDEGEAFDVDVNCDVSGLPSDTDDLQMSRARDSFASAAIEILSCGRLEPDPSGRPYTETAVEFRME